MGEQEDRIVAAMVRLAEAEPDCERHMFVFVGRSNLGALRLAHEAKVRILQDNEVYLLCRDAV